MGEPLVDVTIRAIAAGGSGLGDLPDGRVVFVPRTAPGDRVRIRIEKSKPRWAVGSLRRIVEPGPDRQDALCTLYGECGGCQLQHLLYEKQLEWKGRVVADALSREPKRGFADDIGCNPVAAKRFDNRLGMAAGADQQDLALVHSAAFDPRHSASAAMTRA